MGRVEESVLGKTKERPIDGFGLQLTGWRSSCGGGSGRRVDDEVVRESSVKF